MLPWSVMAADVWPILLEVRGELVDVAGAVEKGVIGVQMEVGELSGHGSSLRDRRGVHKGARNARWRKSRGAVMGVSYTLATRGFGAKDRMIRFRMAIPILCCGLCAAQALGPAAPFTLATDTLRATMLKLASNHKITGADGKVFDYNLSVVSVTADAATCNLTWKDRIDLGVAQQVHTRTVNLTEIARVNSLSSANTKMGVDPFLQIIQIHMKPPATAVDVVERYNGSGQPMGTPETKRVETTIISAANEAEATTVIRELTDLMAKCQVQR